MQRLGKGVRIGLVIALGALVASAVINYRNLNAIAEREALVVHTHQVLDELRLLFSAVNDAETGQRGYIITNDPAYLTPFEEAGRTIDGSYQRLTELTTDNPAQQVRLKSLRELVDKRMSTLAEGVKVRKDGGVEAGTEFVRQGRGKLQMDAIRKSMDRIIGYENRLLDERTKASRAVYASAYATNIITTAVGFVLVASVYGLALRELSERIRREEILERRVQERTEELNIINDALQISNRELEQFASVASHDLQEPLRKIEAFGDRLKTRNAENLDDQGRDFLDRMLVSAARMRTLINDLLTFSRVTTKAQPAAKVSLQKTAEEVASDLEGRLHISEGRIDIGDLPEIEADPLQMRQLLQNLMGNGLKFQRPGVPPVVSVAARVTKNGEGQAVCELTVQDNGIGFDEIYLDRIFNVFQRLHGRNEYEGTGMGLAICRKIVERHRGTITAKSKPNEGARFIVTLPLQQPKKELLS